MEFFNEDRKGRTSNFPKFVVKNQSTRAVPFQNGGTYNGSVARTISIAVENISP